MEHVTRSPTNKATDKADGIRLPKLNNTVLVHPLTTPHTSNITCPASDSYLYEGRQGGCGGLVDDEEREMVVADQGWSPRASAMTTATICVCHCYSQSVSQSKRIGTATHTHTHSALSAKRGMNLLQCTI